MHARTYLPPSLWILIADKVDGQEVAASLVQIVDANVHDRP